VSADTKHYRVNAEVSQKKSSGRLFSSKDIRFGAGGVAIIRLQL